MKKIWKVSLLFTVLVILLAGICVCAQAETKTKEWAQKQINTVCKDYNISMTKEEKKTIKKYWCYDPDVKGAAKKYTASDIFKKGYKGYKYDDSTQCHGFARFIAEKAFGGYDHKDWKTIKAITKNGLHVGDLIRTEKSPHTALIYDIDSTNHLTVIECWGTHNNIIKYKVKKFAGASSFVDDLLNSRSYGKLAYVRHYTKNTSPIIWGGPDYEKAPTLKSVKFSKSSAAVKEKITITAKTSLNAATLTMYDEDGNKAKAWTKGYSDNGEVRTWKVTYAFSEAGNRKLQFKASNVFNKFSNASTAEIIVAVPPKLSNVEFYKAKATQKQKMVIMATTSTNAVKLTMYTEEGKEAKSWTSGYTDTDGVRNWTVTHAFKEAGKRTLTFKAIDADGVASAGKTAKITITKAPSLSSVAFSKTKASVKEKVTITAKTSTNAVKLVMYNEEGNEAKSWTTGYTDKSGVRTWKVTYAFKAAGKRTLTFKAFDANEASTAGKDVAIKIVK